MLEQTRWQRINLQKVLFLDSIRLFPVILDILLREENGRIVKGTKSTWSQRSGGATLEIYWACADFQRDTSRTRNSPCCSLTQLPPLPPRLTASVSL